MSNKINPYLAGLFLFLLGSLLISHYDLVETIKVAKVFMHISIGLAGIAVTLYLEELRSQLKKSKPISSKKKSKK